MSTSPVPVDQHSSLGPGWQQQVQPVPLWMSLHARPRQSDSLVMAVGWLLAGCVISAAGVFYLRALLLLP
jgi:hypothetical protein